MRKWQIESTEVDSVDLKSWVVTKGVKVQPQVYKCFSNSKRLSKNPLACNSFMLSDQTIVQLTDLSFHLSYLTGVLSWSQLKLLRYASQLQTPWIIDVIDEKPALFYKKQLIDYITFFPKSGFYNQKQHLVYPT